MLRLALPLLLFSAASIARAGDSPSLGVEIDPAEIIDQHLFKDSRNACGPAAICNSLRFGNAKTRSIWYGFLGPERDKKLRFAIDRYFLGRQSVVFPEMKRFRPNGTEPEDLAAAYGEILTDHKLRPVKGRFFDRQEDETDSDFVARLHRQLADSLNAGVPPILSLRSFLAQRDESDDSATGGKIAWKPARSHSVVVTRVPKTLPEDELGFRFELIDPNGGKVRSAFVYAEPQQAFIALRGNERTGQWLTGSPFLVVQAPGVVSLQPKDAVWRDRIVIVAHHLIGSSFGWE